MFSKRILVVHSATESLALSLYTRKQSTWVCTQQQLFKGLLTQHATEILLFLKKTGAAKTIITLPYHFIFQKKLMLPAALSRSQLLNYIGHKKTEWFPTLTTHTHTYIETISRHEKMITLTPTHQLDPLLSLLKKTRLTICTVTLCEYLIKEKLAPLCTKTHGAYLYQSSEDKVTFTVFTLHEIIWHTAWTPSESNAQLLQFFKKNHSLSIDTLFLINDMTTLSLEGINIVPVTLDLSVLALQRVQHEI